MSVPETESAQAAERAATAAAAAPGKADPSDDPRLPWHGKPRAADIFCWLGIVLSFARAGDGTLAVVLLAAIPGLMKFDALYWWAGRLWGERFIMTLPGSRRVAKHMPRVQRAGRKFTWPAVVVSSFLPIPRAIIGVIAGWAGMRLVTFLILDLIGALLWAGLLAGLGYALGHHAVVAARTISHYSWWFTIGIVALSVLLTVRSQRRLAAAAPAGQKPVRRIRLPRKAG